MEKNHNDEDKFRDDEAKAFDERLAASGMHIEVVPGRPVSHDSSQDICSLSDWMEYELEKIWAISG